MHNKIYFHYIYLQFDYQTLICIKITPSLNQSQLYFIVKPSFAKHQVLSQSPWQYSCIINMLIYKLLEYRATTINALIVCVRAI